jgi:protein gp37
VELGASCWWDFSYNFLGGCRKLGESCRNCWAPTRIGNVVSAHDVALYRGTTRRLRNGRQTWTGQAGALAPGHNSWVLPLEPPVVKRPKLGPGKPLLVAINLTGDTFFEKHPFELIDRGLLRVAASDHIGLLLTRRVRRMLEYFLRLEAELSPEALQRWKKHLWLGFSAGNQDEFNEYWPYLRELAQRGWTTFVSLAPLIGKIVLPDDFLRLIKWVIVSGECDTAHCRKMDPAWARSLLAQCRAAHVPFFMKRMSGRKHIPPDLLIREFPAVG